MTQILVREICFRRKAVLFYPEGFTQVTLTGLFSFRDLWIQTLDGKLLEIACSILL